MIELNFVICRGPCMNSCNLLQIKTQLPVHLSRPHSFSERWILSGRSIKKKKKKKQAIQKGRHILFAFSHLVCNYLFELQDNLRAIRNGPTILYRSATVMHGSPSSVFCYQRISVSEEVYSDVEWEFVVITKSRKTRNSQVCFWVFGRRT